MRSQAILLAKAGNFAVVQLPERNYPGVVIQGDTLSSLVGLLNDIKTASRCGDLENLEAAIADAAELLGEAQEAYEKACGDEELNCLIGNYGERVSRSRAPRGDLGEIGCC